MTNDSATMTTIMIVANIAVRFKSPSTSLYSACQLISVMRRTGATAAPPLAETSWGAALAAGELNASGGRFGRRCLRDLFDIVPLF